MKKKSARRKEREKMRRRDGGECKEKFRDERGKELKIEKIRHRNGCSGVERELRRRKDERHEK